MYCTECGKQNPDRAKFCAFCGASLLPDKKNARAEIIEAEFVEAEPSFVPRTRVERAAQRAKAAAPDSPAEGDEFSRGAVKAPAAAIKPRMEDESSRAAVKAPAAAIKPRAEDESSRGVVKAPAASKSRAEDDFLREAVKARPTGEGKPAHRTIQPLDDNPAQPSRGGMAKRTLEPVKKPRPAREVAVTASGEREEIPERQPPVKQLLKRKRDMPSTLVPERKKLAEREDLFFDDVTFSEEDEEEEEREHEMRYRAKSIAAGAFLLVVLAVAFWLLATGSGQVFRASLGLGAPAVAYKTLGDQARAGGQIKRAADAYYNAMKLDPENFQYVLLVAQTQEIVGNKDVAEKAYLKCIQLKETAVEPYRLLAGMYEQRGEQEKAAAIRQRGYQNTGDETLREGSEE